MKSNLPVIVLKGIVLLPNNDVRLEFENDGSKNIIDTAELFHDNNVLLVSQIDPLEEKPKVEELPMMGIVCRISHKIELPNGKMRVLLTGLYRAKVVEYLNLHQTEEALESIVQRIKTPSIDEKEEKVYINKLYKEIEEYTNRIPYVGNSMLSSIQSMESLSMMTDTIVPFLQISLERGNEYLSTIDPKERLEMILNDIHEEEEMFAIEHQIDMKVKKTLDDSQREYLLREKMKLIKEELGDTVIKDNEVEELRQRIDELNAPEKIKDKLYTELHKYESLSPMSPEINVVRDYMEWLLCLPWNQNTIDNDDLEDVRTKLDTSHNGLEKVKTRIIEYLAVKQMTNSLRGPIICLVGPPGVGKTSLAFSIAEAMNRKFVKMSVGGISDEAELIGHRRTYVGASPGRIISALKKAKSSNPVFLIDEIDKMTKNYKGDPASVLLEILDPEQNKYFSDHYIEEEYDLSKVMFIATANYIENIPEALKDRLEIVNLSSYTEYEKIDIAEKYSIPKICREHGVNPAGIVFKQDAIVKMIRNYTKEAGVRELERQIATIIRKIITTMVTKRIIVNKYMIDVKKVTEYLGKEKYSDSHIKIGEVGVVNGLAYTSFGGDTLPIEVNYFEGKGNLILTGSLGDVMKESAMIALNYVKSNYKQFGIDYQKLIENDIHINAIEAAIPKDGPSAGITLTTAIISAFTGKKVSSKVAMTGEITLRGKVLEIGGLKEKSIGAHRNGIETIFIPEENKKDLDEIPEEIKKDITYVPVKNYKEVYTYLFDTKESKG